MFFSNVWSLVMCQYMKATCWLQGTERSGLWEKVWGTSQVQPWHCRHRGRWHATSQSARYRQQLPQETETVRRLVLPMSANNILLIFGAWRSGVSHSSQSSWTVWPPGSGGLGSTPGFDGLSVHAGQLSAYSETNIWYLGQAQVRLCFLKSVTGH